MLLVINNYTGNKILIIAFISSVQSLSHVRLFATPWTVALRVHAVLHARILKWITMVSSRGSS